MAADEETRRQLRERLRRELLKHGADDLAGVLAKCAEKLHLTCTCCGEQKVVEVGCRKRWCPVCSRKIAATLVARHSYALSMLQWPLMVTLTVRSKSYAEGSVRELVESFFRFRRRRWWKACNIKGGIRGVEITHGAGGWHPHLHLLMDCEWLAVNTPKPPRRCHPDNMAILCKSAQKELAAEWAEHTGQDISIVWVTRAKPETVREIIKYTVDPADLVEMGPNMVEAIRCMAKTRATQTWGSCHGLVGKMKAVEDAAWEPPLCESAARGEYQAHAPQWIPTALVTPSEKQRAARDQRIVRELAAKNKAEWAAFIARRKARKDWEAARITLAKYQAAIDAAKQHRVQRGTHQGYVRL